MLVNLISKSSSYVMEGADGYYREKAKEPKKIKKGVAFKKVTPFAYYM